MTFHVDAVAQGPLDPADLVALHHARAGPGPVRVDGEQVPVPAVLHCVARRGQGEGTIWLRDLAAALGPGQPVHEILYASAIIFFCFFYTALQYNPKETAENLKKSGAFDSGPPQRSIPTTAGTARACVTGCHPASLRRIITGR